jgi:histidine ammonia-lyase
MFRAVLKGSSLYDPGAARAIQDALSFRVLSQIYGPALTSLETAIAAVELEINAAADNPLVLADDGLILSTANFHTPAIALAFDMLAIVNTHLATAAGYRIIKLMNPALSGLAKYLSPVGGASTGFNSLQKTVSYLHAEIRLKATPGSLDSLPVSDAVEDHAPHTPLTIRKLEEQLLPLRLLIAIEALVAAQAVDLRGGVRLAPVTRLLFDAIRAEVPRLTQDRPTGPDVDRVCSLMRSETLLSAMVAAAGADWAIPLLGGAHG